MQHLCEAWGVVLVGAYATIRSLDDGFDATFDVMAGGNGGCPHRGNSRATGMAATEGVLLILRAMASTGVSICRA